MLLQRAWENLCALGDRGFNTDKTQDSEEAEPSANDFLKDLVAQNEALQQKIALVKKHADEQCIAKVRAEEMARRRKEELDSCRNEANDLVEDKYKLLAQISTFQRLDSPLDDDEMRRIIHRLHRGLEIWVMRHTSNTTGVNRHVDPNLSNDDIRPSASFEVQERIHTEVLESVFQWIWAPFMVGFRNAFQDPFLDHFLSDLDAHIHRSSPTYIWQYWRLAMSDAAASVEDQFLNASYHHIVCNVETKFSSFLTTDRDKRTSQLCSFIKDCYKFKKQLERQGSIYFLRCNPRGVPYNQESMNSFTGDESLDQLVEVSLWPMLVKAVGPQQFEIVERELVRTAPQSCSETMSAPAKMDENMVSLREMYSQTKVNG